MKRRIVFKEGQSCQKFEKVALVHYVSIVPMSIMYSLYRKLECSNRNFEGFDKNEDGGRKGDIFTNTGRVGDYGCYYTSVRPLAGSHRPVEEKKRQER